MSNKSEKDDKLQDQNLELRRAVNDAYAFFRGSNNSAGENSVARTRAARAASATPWHEVVRHRAQAEARAKEARRAKEENARQGKAISRPKTGGPKPSRSRS